MKNHHSIILGLLIFAILGSSCETLQLKPTYENDPQGVFEALWTVFDEHYGGFLVKDVNWDSMYQELSPRLDKESSDEELYNTCVDLLRVLEDPHVGFFPLGEDLPTFWGGRYGRIDTVDDFNLDVILGNYLPKAQETNNLFIYDTLPGNIGYVYIRHFGFGERVTRKEFNQVMDALKDTKGMIIDIRGGFGGEDVAGKVIASRFADQQRHYMNTRVKNGPAHDDFTEKQQWYIEPEGDFQYTQPTMILTNLQTLSARETFLLAMRVLPHVSQAGDTTAGGFSNANPGELPNGWGYTISVGEWTDGNGTSFEGVGIPPDIYFKSSREGLLEGRDELLEKAIDMLR